MSYRWFVVLALAFPLSPVVRGADAGDDKMDGTWLMESAEIGGQKFPDEIRKAAKLVIKDGKYTVTIGPGESDQGTVKLDLKAKPKTMDITSTDGPNKGKTILAIYELNDDTMKVCYDLGGKSRPTAFKSEPGTQLFLVTYKRQKT